MILVHLEKEKEPVTILFTGSSGAFIAGFLAPFLSNFTNSVTLHYLPKKHEQRHYTNPIQITGLVYIVDDFIVTGNTVDKMLTNIVTKRIKLFMVYGNGQAFYETPLFSQPLIIHSIEP